MRIQNFYSLNRDAHTPLPASPTMVALGSTNRLHSGANYGGTSDVLVLVLISVLDPNIMSGVGNGDRKIQARK